MNASEQWRQTVPGWPDWALRREAARAWVKQAGREELEEFALREHDRGDIGWLGNLVANHDEGMIAQRQASWAISDFMDWQAQSLRPSHQLLQQRRAEAGLLCREVVQ